ncbi:MAG: threonylcarbamoyl-AMP synthase [Candidatus Rokubacteria bacterium]|nr:threonylcarbamoyl-AMP synthase [Candidatus Rokubacteria bacterium]
MDRGPDAAARDGVRVLAVDPAEPAAADVAVAARVLQEGGLVAFPTETFYGLGADALDPVAVARVFGAKGRPADKPLLVLVDSMAMAARVTTEIPARARRLAARYWPGPLTLILRARSHVPPALTAGTATIGLRIPAHPVALALVRAAGVPVTAPSANPHGVPAPRTAAEVLAGLDDRVDLVLDGGPTRGGPPSTLLDLTGPAPRLVRPGAVRLGPEDLAGP